MRDDLRTGAIEVTPLAEWSRGSAIEVKSGRTCFEVQATTKGQKTYIVMPEFEGYFARLKVLLPDGRMVIIHVSKQGQFVSAYDGPEGRYIASLDLTDRETVSA